MTVSSTTRAAGPFLGNGVTTQFPFEFKVFEAADLAVYFTDGDGLQTLLTSGYTVTLNADQDTDPGGTITYPNTGSPMAADESLSAIGDLEFTQETDLTNAGRYLPTVVEDALDRQVILSQQLAERMTRSLTVPVGDVGGELPGEDERAGMYLAFDADGVPVAASGTGADSGLRADLAATGGAALVKFTPYGPYAVERTLQAKGRDVLDFADFGGVYDGTNQDAVLTLIDTWSTTFYATTGLVVEFSRGDVGHGNVVFHSSGLLLKAKGDCRLLKTTTTGNGLEFKATAPARNYRCGLQGFTLGNKSANGVSGANVNFENITGAVCKDITFLPYPFAPFNALRFKRCTNITYLNVNGESCVDTGVIFEECGGLRGGMGRSDTNGGYGFEFDTCTGNYLAQLEAYGNADRNFYVHADATVGTDVSDQSAFFFPNNWVGDTSGDHNIYVKDTTIGEMVACWGATQGNTAVADLCGIVMDGCDGIDLVACDGVRNNGQGIFVLPSCRNVNIYGGNQRNNGQAAGTTNKAGILHQGSGVIEGVKADKGPRAPLVQQYGILYQPTDLTLMMRIRDNDVSNNTVGGLSYSAGLTNFEESGNYDGASTSLASAVLVTLPPGKVFTLTGAVDTYDFTPTYKGRELILTWASTARLIAGTAIRLPSANIQPNQYGSAHLLHDGTRWVHLTSSVNDNV